MYGLTAENDEVKRFLLGGDISVLVFALIYVPAVDYLVGDLGVSEVVSGLSQCRSLVLDSLISWLNKIMMVQTLIVNFESASTLHEILFMSLTL